jgi:large subunit ribosomal protein L35
MPKMKTHRAAAKRMRVTGSGKVRRARAGLQHLMRGKSARRRRALRKSTILDMSDLGRVQHLLPYSF